MSEPLKTGDRTFRSRLIIGTGKYENFEVMKRAHEASGAELVTVAIRRINLEDPSEETILDHIDQKRYTLLPNTAGCYTAEEAIRVARLARQALNTDLIKLEVIGDEKTLLPNNLELFKAAEVLLKEGFFVMPYTNDDVVVCKQLEEMGCPCVMPLAAPIGSGQGVLNPLNITLIIEASKVPVIVDAGVGTASDAVVAMELGADGVLMNTAIACAKDPVKMAEAMRQAVEAGRLAYEAGRIPKKPYASASSPLEGALR